MPVILVVETDVSYAQRISEALQSAGWPVEVCESAESAERRAAIRPPSLVVASSALPDVRSLLGRFARAQGGPGSVALIPTTLVGRISAVDYRADALLPKPFTAEEARRVLLPMLAARDAPRTQLSSADIFGEVLAEVEGRTPAPPAPPRPRASSSSAEIDRRLEETLSGVLSLVEPRRAGGPRARKTSTEDIDELLDKTLSSLEMPRTKKPPAPPRTSSPAPFETLLPVPAAAADVSPPVFEPPPPLEIPALPGIPAAVARPAAAAPVAARAQPPFPRAPEPRRMDEFRTQRLAVVAPRETNEGEVFGDYTLIRRIAVGGMAEVWQARRRGVEGFQKTVAIKKILSHLTGSSDFVSMFIDEAKLAAQLNHNNIIQIYDLGKVGEGFFIAMEHVDGMDVRTILGQAQAKGRPLPMRLALLIASSVARALDYAHRKRDFDNQALGLVHRDVSPQNVLISHEGEIKLCDFGIVKAVAKASTTQMGALKGKLQYMSPEQAWGKTVDARSDIFSLGSVTFEMLTGTRLFTGDSEIGVLDAVRECRVRSPRELAPGVPDEVDRIVRRALAKDPEERYQTAGEMDEDLKDVIVGLKPMPSQAELAAYLEELAAAPELDESEAAAREVSAAAVSAALQSSPPAPQGALRDLPADPAARAETPSFTCPAASAEGAGPPSAAPVPDAAPRGRRERRGRGPLVKLLIAAVLVAAVSAAVYFALKAADRGRMAESPAAPVTGPELPAQDAGTPEGGPAEPAAPAAEPTPAAEELDLEGLVDQELARQREEIEKKLEEELGAEKRQLQKELEAARRAAAAAEKGDGG
jgi:CheY-like chemotaxis protein